MNKAELVESLANETGLTKRDARAALDGVVDVVTKALQSTKPVVITGFGKFTTVKRKATTRMNPQTGRRIRTPARMVPAFKAGKSLKEIVARTAK
jgi:DNA-binding protein HU-beta